MKNFLVLIFFSLFFLIISQSVHADEVLNIPPLPSPTPIASVDYPLPYPGILPDNPLYFMKALRDRVVSMFITDPLKKAQFNLLMADIRLNSALYLFVKGERKYSLAETTISKGENYFYNSLIMIDDARAQGMPVNNFVSTLLKSAQKHQEVIKELESKSTDGIKDRLIDDEKRARDFEIRVTQIKPK